MKTKPEDLTEAEYECSSIRNESLVGRFVAGFLVLVGLLLAVHAICCLTSCATTTLYRDNGRPMARFQGDMQNMRFRALADGSMEWDGAVVHSSATKAGGNATAKNVSAAGAVAASAATLLSK